MPGEALAAITERAMAKETEGMLSFRSGHAGGHRRKFKRNPSVKFEYQYLTDTAPTRYIDKVVNKTATKTALEASSVPEQARVACRPRRHKNQEVAGAAHSCGNGGGAIGVAILVFLIFKYEGNGMFSQSMDVDLPNFIGLTQAEIQKKYPIQNSFFQTEE